MKRGVLAGVFVLVLLIGSGAGYGWYLAGRVHHIDVRGLHGAFATGSESGTENILMVGSTTRCGLAHQNAAYGLCSSGVTGVNSDVIMVLHLNASTHAVSILSIPRDVFIPNARSTGANKVDAGLEQGPSQLVAAVEEDFAIPIQHFVVLNFDTFANVVDALGGINMDFPMPVLDAYSGLQVLSPGCLHLDGLHALQVVRARHLQYKGPGVTNPNPRDWPTETQSDLARIRRDHEFLRVLATAVSKKSLSNPITDIQMVNAVAPNLWTDMSTSDMVSLVRNFHAVNANSAPQLTLPVAVDNNGSYIYKGGNYGDIEFPSASQDQAAIDQVLGIGAISDSMTGNPLPSPSTVAVSVLNGTGVSNQAADTASALSALGFHTVGVGDTPSVASQSETVVYFGSRTTTVQAAAEAVARSMTGLVVMAYDPSMVAHGAQVTVVTGTQFAVNTPASATAPSATPAPPSSSGIAAPTPTTEGLRPWDPRACPAPHG